jgi:hypothetical protein
VCFSINLLDEDGERTTGVGGDISCFSLAAEAMGQPVLLGREGSKELKLQIQQLWRDRQKGGA